MKLSIISLQLIWTNHGAVKDKQIQTKTELVGQDCNCWRPQKMKVELLKHRLIRLIPLFLVFLGISYACISVFYLSQLPQLQNPQISSPKVVIKKSNGDIRLSKFQELYAKAYLDYSDDDDVDPIVKRELGDEARLLTAKPANSDKKCPSISTATLVYDPECYAAQRLQYEFSDEPLRQVNVTTFEKIGHPEGRNFTGVIVIMCSSVPRDVESLKSLLKRVDRMMLQSFSYPVAIFHENFTTEMMEDIANLVSATIHFVQIEFKIPANLEPISKYEPILVKHWTNNHAAMPFRKFHTHLHGLVYYNKRQSMGYYHMCRFFAGAGYKLPFFDQFDMVMRLDSDSDIVGRLPDYFQKMKEQNRRYLYSKEFIDGGDVTAGLWNFVQEYIQTKNMEPTFFYKKTIDTLKNVWEAPSYPNCSRLNPSKLNMTTRNYNGVRLVTQPCVDNHFQGVPSFYTNFEIVDVKFLRSPEYQAWFNAVDATGSIYLHRWGDAPLRFLGLSMHMNTSQIAVEKKTRVIHRGVDKSKRRKSPLSILKDRRQQLASTQNSTLRPLSEMKYMPF
jgi:hypothetical protein